MAFFSWSKTAGSNGNSDNTINMAEGQGPGSLNDGCRAIMARLAEFRDDTSGLLTTGGTATAYTITTNQGFASTPIDGQLIVFTPHVTNGAAATLKADGGTAFALHIVAGTALPLGSIVAGTPYAAKFVAASSAWVLHSTPNLFNIPLGGVMPFMGSSAPNSSFALLFGQAISRTTFANLFALISTAFGVGDGSTTFNLPDLRGRAPFGQDNMGGSAANRITSGGNNYDGTIIGGSGGAQNSSALVAHTHSITDVTHTHTIPQAAAHQFNVQTGEVNVQVGTTTTSASLTGINGTNSAGSGSSYSILSPSVIMSYIGRIQ